MRLPQTAVAAGVYCKNKQMQFLVQVSCDLMYSDRFTGFRYWIQH